MFADRTSIAAPVPADGSAQEQDSEHGEHLRTTPPRPATAPCPAAGKRDLIIGAGNRSAIGTLVERSSNYTVLVPLPDGYKPDQVAPALARKIQRLPEQLRLALTWDQEAEMRDWEKIRIDTGIEIFFCDPKSPWQRGINENTNGLLRQYFPKGTELAGYSEEHLDAVAAELNDRPRKRLEFQTPSEVIGDILLR